MSATPEPRSAMPYPLILEPVFHARVWGGRRLAEVLGAQLPEGAIGESWSMGDDNRVLNGPLAGQTLGDLVATDPDVMLGRLVVSSGRTDLPLLFKILDANESLSIQVHPDDRVAREVEHVPFGKTEAWYVLDAAPGAYVIHGFTRPVPPDEARAGLADGSITDALRKVELKAGEAILVPAGTIHAIGGGMLLGEIQENSDITYRLYDWGRPREMHLDKGLAVLDLQPPGFGPSRPLDVTAGASTIRYLVACHYFAYQLLIVQGALNLDTARRSLHVLFCTAGAGAVRYAGGSVDFAQGQTLFLPGALGAYTVEGEACRLLRCFVPEPGLDLFDPLLQAGYAAAEIAALGGPPGNELEHVTAPAGDA
jgi:mannose-6-phosphate isomerase